MDQSHQYLTKEKYEEFKKELAHLKTDKRKEIAESLEYAKSLGDLSENAEYHEARNAQALVEDRINHLEALLKSASIVSTHDTSAVNVGSSVTVQRVEDKYKNTYTIVGSEEANAAQGKISLASPLGQAVMHKKKGDSFSFKTPSGIMNFKVIDIK